jgi:hypothetical protein
MKTNVVIIVSAIIILLGIGKFYLDHNANQKALIEAEQEKTKAENERKALLQGEMATLKASLEESNQKIATLEAEMNSLNAEIEGLEKDKKQIASRQAWLSSQLRNEKAKVDKAKNSIVSILNSQLSNLLDHRIRKFSTFNDDSSFSYYTGRRHYISLEKNNTIKLERSVLYTATGQYLKPMFQDKDNGNNRFLTTSYTAALKDLRLNDAEIIDPSKKEKMPFQKDFNEVTFINLKIPVAGNNNASMLYTIEYEGETFDKKSKVPEIQVYTISESEANEVLNLLKMLQSLS